MTQANLNPVIPGFAPDPSVVRIGHTFYIVTSSFHLFPGLPIYSSTDLHNWSHIGNAINRETQLSLLSSKTNLSSTSDYEELIPATGGLYAPTIRHHKGVTYILCTNVIHSSDSPSHVSFKNFILSTDDVEADQWSDPVYFSFCGIDPDLFFDNSGRAYVQGSKWGDKTTINSFEIDLRTGEKLSSERVIWNGFSGVIPEGPHLYTRAGWIYLLAAEGGTHDGHQITVARSKGIEGPFESYSNNPILGPAMPNDEIQWTGHGDIFADDSGKWWLLCLGARKTGPSCIMGRETFLSRVEWTADDWPSIAPLELNPVFEGMQENCSVIVHHPKAKPRTPLHAFISIRDPLIHISNIVRDEEGTQLALRLSSTDLNSCGSISFIGKRPRRRHGRAILALDTCQMTSSTNYQAGLAYYKDEHRFCRIGWSSATSEVFCELVNVALSSKTFTSKTMCPGGSVVFSILYRPDLLEFLFKDSITQTEIQLASFDTKYMTGRDFVGPVIGAFVTASCNSEEEIQFSQYKVD